MTEIQWLQYAPVVLDGDTWVGSHVAHYDDFELTVSPRGEAGPWGWSVEHAFDDTNRESGITETSLDDAKVAASAAMARMLAARMAHEDAIARRRPRP